MSGESRRGDLWRVLRSDADDKEGLAAAIGFENSVENTPNTKVRQEPTPSLPDAPISEKPLRGMQLLQPNGYAPVTERKESEPSLPESFAPAWPETQPRCPPDHSPIFSPDALALSVIGHLATFADHGSIDQRKAVNAVALGRIVQRFPRHRRRKAVDRVALVTDKSSQLAPFFEDFALFGSALDARLRNTELDLWTWSAELQCYAGASRVRELRPDMPCILLTDFAHPELWRPLGEHLRASWLPAIALSLGQRAHIPEAKRLWWIEHLDRRDAGDEKDLTRLLTLSAPAIYLQPALLRTIRQSLVGNAGPALEARVWRRTYLQSLHPTAGTFERHVIGTFRERFATSREITNDDRRAALRILRAHRFAVAPEVYFAEILAIGPRVIDWLEEPRDYDDARNYFTLRAGENTSRHRLHYFSELGEHFAPQGLGDHVEELKTAILTARKDDPSFQPNTRARDMPAIGLPVGDIRIVQRGERLEAAPPGSDVIGSIVAIVPSANGGVDVEEDPAREIWGSERLPDWVSDHGTDEYGHWAEFRVDGVVQRLRWIPPGQFLMGSPEGEDGRDDDEGPQVEITFASGYWMADTVVTQALWEAVMDEKPSRFEGDERPVERVSWEDAGNFIDTLNDLVPGLALQLPSEAAWEYACRAGTTTPYFFGDEARTEEIHLGPEETCPVRAKHPNHWGMYQMHGNVGEWCADEWSGSHQGADASGKPRADRRDRWACVIRGGGPSSAALSLRSAYRRWGRPDLRHGKLGFRLAIGQVYSSQAPAAHPSGKGPVRKAEPRSDFAGRNTAKHGSNFSIRAQYARVIKGGSAATLALPTGPFVIRTDRAELVISRVSDMDLDWASGVGRDRYGLWAHFAVGDVRSRLRWIPPGRFLMGSPKDEPAYRSLAKEFAYYKGRESPQIEINFDKGFWLMDAPVTQALWEAVMGGNPSEYKSTDRPVEGVSWRDAQSFIADLNAETKGTAFGLPSEAAWEYACRAGTTDATYAGPFEILGKRNAPVLDEIAWYGGNSGVDWDLAVGRDASGWGEKQHPFDKAGTRRIRQKRPNGWGLYDMLGNVWEWCEDISTTTHDGANVGGAARLASEQDGERTRVVRGGSWSSSARYVRSAVRYWRDPDLGYSSLGFRLALGQVSSGNAPEAQVSGKE